MNYLITGGTGLIGRALIKVLSEQKQGLTVLTRDIKKAAKFFNSDTKLINSLLLSDIENNDIIINLAGESIANKRWTTKQKNNICESRWHITQQLTDFIAQAKNPPTLFISGSAIGIYGRQSAQAIDESFKQYHHEFTVEVCSKWEEIALSAQSDKTRVAILRTGIVLAKADGALAKMLLPFKLGLGGKIGSGKQVMSWIHLQDMVNAILHIQHNNILQGPINVTSGDAVSNEAFTSTLAKALKRPSVFPMPEFVAKMLFGEMSDILLYGQNVVPHKLKDSGFSMTYPTLTSALTNILK